MIDHPYPEIGHNELSYVEPSVFLETAGSLRKIPLQPGDDPVEVAQRHVDSHPLDTRFRLVRVQRFSLTATSDRDVRENPVGMQCSATTHLDDGTELRCELEPHGDGVDHAARVRQHHRTVDVKFWRAPV